MSVYIEGMDLPTSCATCKLFGEYGCPLIGTVTYALTRGERHKDCPLIPVQPNVDLIESEDAQNQGLLVRLPCKVGETVWSRDVEPWTVVSVEWFSRKVTQLHCKSPVTGRRMTFSVGKRSLGKTVFLTREEAEAKVC